MVNNFHFPLYITLNSYLQFNIHLIYFQTKSRAGQKFRKRRHIWRLRGLCTWKAFNNTKDFGICLVSFKYFILRLTRKMCYHENPINIDLLLSWTYLAFHNAFTRFCNLWHFKIWKVNLKNLCYDLYFMNIHMCDKYIYISNIWKPCSFHGSPKYESLKCT